MPIIIALIFCIYHQVIASDLITTQHQISQTYQKINTIDQSITNIQSMANAHQQEILLADKKLLSIDQSLKTINQKITLQHQKIKDGSRKLYILSFSPSESAQVYFSYYLKSIMKQHLKIKDLQKELKSAHVEQQEKTKQLTAIKKQHEITLMGMKNQRQELSAQIIKLQKALTRTVEKSSSDAVSPHHFKPINLSGMQHKLSWPASGTIKQRFAEAISGSKLKSDAIILKFQKTTDIRAIHPGIVVHNQWLPAYGYLVIIDHGFGFHSLYGHLDQVQVRKDQIVQTNDVIGQSSPSSENPNNQLYFALKHHLKPLDPEKWLK